MTSPVSVLFVLIATIGATTAITVSNFTGFRNATNEAVPDEISDLNEVLQVISEWYKKPKTPTNITVRTGDGLLSYFQERNALAEKEILQVLGSDVTLNDEEQEANKILLDAKYAEYDASYQLGSQFLAGENFFEVRNQIENSKVFQIIRKMPKGGYLNTMEAYNADFEFYYNLTFGPNLFFSTKDGVQYLFSSFVPGPEWKSLRIARRRAQNDDLENIIRNSLTINGTTGTLEQRYHAVSRAHLQLTSYLPNYLLYWRRVLQNLVDDNIMFMEVHGGFAEVYDQNATKYSPFETLQIVNREVENFRRRYPNFIGAKYCYTVQTVVNNSALRDYRITTAQLFQANPSLITGFMLNNHKQALHPIVEELLKFPKAVKFDLAAGRTTFWGVDSDYNLLDGLLLPTRRLLCDLSLHKHPLILQTYRERGIAVVTCPIASQAFGFIDDLRNHPHAYLAATNYPLVIGSGKASLFNVTGLSCDFYEFFMASTPRGADIRALKQLALNSLLYSSLPVEDKKVAVETWSKQWNYFIKNIIKEYRK